MGKISHNIHGRHIASSLKAEKIVGIACEDELTLKQVTDEVNNGQAPTINNADCFYISTWSKFTFKELRDFFPHARPSEADKC